MDSCADKIEAEVRAIVDDCAASSRPLDCLGEHLAQLRDDPNWEFEDTLRVASTALRRISTGQPRKR